MNITIINVILIIILRLELYGKQNQSIEFLRLGPSKYPMHVVKCAILISTQRNSLAIGLIPGIGTRAKIY